MDVLSDVLSAVRLTGAVFFDVHAFSPWVSVTPAVERFRHAVMPNAEHVVAFHVVVTGSCWAELPGVAPPSSLKAGDFVVITMGDEHLLSSAPGMRGKTDLNMYRRPGHRPLPVPFTLNEGGGPEDSHFVCGYLGCDVRPFNPLLEALPRLFHASVSATSREWLLALIRAGVDETQQGTAGGDTMLARLAELMFVEVIRDYMARLPPDERGWCSGIGDPQVGGALRLIHGQPSDPWTVEALARGVGMSRSAFHDRFVSFLGVPPMQYLARWRLQVATRLLTDRAVTISSAAAGVGYESEAAFNRAFKRFVGVTPGAWRKSRAHAPALRAK